MGIIDKLKTQFISSRSCAIDFKDCTAMPSTETILETVKNWTNENKKDIAFIRTTEPVTFAMEGAEYKVKIRRERGAYTLYITTNHE